MQRTADGTAASLSSPMGLPQSAHTPCAVGGSDSSWPRSRMRSIS